MIGSDFERFTEVDGEAVPSTALNLPGKFDVPVPVYDESGEAGVIHRDNVMLEMCVPAQADGQGLVTAVKRVVSAASEWVRAVDPKMTIGNKTSVIFPAKTLLGQDAQELGCDIDYLVGDLDSDPRAPLSARLLGSLRCAGGHLHFSWPRREVPAWVGAAICDVLIGFREAAFLDYRRAGFYGFAGLHRPTSYPDGTAGVEYRPLDSYWTTDDTSLSRVAALANAVHSVLHNSSMDSLGEYVKKWREVAGAKRPILALVADDNDVHNVVAWGVEHFHKEFGYDPV
jgi:hypothetical protein